MCFRPFRKPTRPRPYPLSLRVSDSSRITVCALFIFVLLPARSETATAAFPAIHCRCSTLFSASPFQHAFWTALPLRTLSTTAPIPAFLCHCGKDRRTHLPKVIWKLPDLARLRKVDMRHVRGKRLHIARGAHLQKHHLWKVR